MGLFRDSRDRRDLSLKVCWTLAVWLMTQQLRCDVNEADEAEQRRLERHPELGHARAVLAGLLTLCARARAYVSLYWRNRVV